MKKYIFITVSIILIMVLTGCSIVTNSSLETNENADYSVLLKEYKMLADEIFQNHSYLYEFMDTDNADEWQEENFPTLDRQLVWHLVVDGLTYREKDDYGYALKDLNEDGKDELIILLRGNTIRAIFSQVGGKVSQLAYFSERYECLAIDESGLLYTYGFDGSADWCYQIQKVSDKGNELLCIEEFGSSSEDLNSEEDPYYYMTDNKQQDGEKVIIEKSELEDLLSKYPYFTDRQKATEATEKSGMVFVPVLD